MILRERLPLSPPLQRLYERIYFDKYDLVSALEPHDTYKDLTVDVKQFI